MPSQIHSKQEIGAMSRQGRRSSRAPGLRRCCESSSKMVPLLAMVLLLVLLIHVPWCQGKGNCNIGIAGPPQFMRSILQVYKEVFLMFVPEAKLQRKEHREFEDVGSFLSASEAYKKMLNSESFLRASYLRARKLPDGNANVTFGGSLGLFKRKSYFQFNQTKHIACGFINYPSTGFVIAESDRAAMSKCKGLVVVTAIFGTSYELKQPSNVDPVSSAQVCFFAFVDDEGTLSRLKKSGIEPDDKARIGLWRVVVVTRLPYEHDMMNTAIPKHLAHRLFPNSAFSIWVEGRRQLVMDPLVMLERFLLRPNATVSLAMHPFNLHTLEEAAFLVRWRLCNKESVWHQMEMYCLDGLQPWSQSKHPYTSDVPDSSLILRQHQPLSNHLSCLWFNELELFNSVDQLAFAYVRDMMSPKVSIHMFNATHLPLLATSQSLNEEIHEQCSARPSLKNVFRTRTSCVLYIQNMWKN